MNRRLLMLGGAATQVVSAQPSELDDLRRRVTELEQIHVFDAKTSRTLLGIVKELSDRVIALEKKTGLPA